jgi:hypothetical protein
VSKPYAQGAGGSVAALNTDAAAAQATINNRTVRPFFIIRPPLSAGGVYNPGLDGAHSIGHRARGSVDAVPHARRSPSARRQTQSQRNNWLDNNGHPGTESLRLTERFHRRDFGHIDLQMTIDDPKAYTKPWTVTVPLQAMPDGELIEYVCDENEKDLQHLVGK